jgi:hypothetical protein
MPRATLDCSSSRVACVTNCSALGPRISLRRHYDFRRRLGLGAAKGDRKMSGAFLDAGGTSSAANPLHTGHQRNILRRIHGGQARRVVLATVHQSAPGMIPTPAAISADNVWHRHR